jgi:hypothetical protein
VPGLEYAFVLKRLFTKPPMAIPVNKSVLELLAACGNTVPGAICAAGVVTYLVVLVFGS